MRPQARRSRKEGGFTLIELVVSMVVLGIISAIVAVFLQKPIEGYFDTARRAQLVNTADFALRRIARDLATAVPNSIRTTGGRDIVEMLQARSAGRYCNAADCDALLDGNGTFGVLGPAVAVVAGDAVIIGNLPDSGCEAYSATSPNRRTVGNTSTPVTSVNFTGGAFSSDCAELTSRFDIASGPLAYACDSTTATLWRYSGYAIQEAVPATVGALNGLVALAGAKAVLATNVNCASTFFDRTSIAEALIEMRIRIEDSTTEGVTLYRQVKVDNTP